MRSILRKFSSVVPDIEHLAADQLHSGTEHGRNRAGGISNVHVGPPELPVDNHSPVHEHLHHELIDSQSKRIRGETPNSVAKRRTSHDRRRGAVSKQLTLDRHLRFCVER